jgi:hypothetical protein
MQACDVASPGGFALCSAAREAIMAHDFTAAARVKWHSDEEEPPEDWGGAIRFATLREALEAIVNGMPQTGHPWVRCGRRIFSPHEVEDLWREDRML